MLRMSRLVGPALFGLVLVGVVNPTHALAQEVVDRCFAPRVLGWEWEATELDPVPTREHAEELPAGMPRVFALLDEPGIGLLGEPRGQRIATIEPQETSREYPMEVWLKEGDKLLLTWTTGHSAVAGQFEWDDSLQRWTGSLRSRIDVVGRGTWGAETALEPVPCPDGT